MAYTLWFVYLREMSQRREEWRYTERGNHEVGKDVLAYRFETPSVANQKS